MDSQDPRHHNGDYLVLPPHTVAWGLGDCLTVGRKTSIAASGAVIGIGAAHVEMSESVRKLSLRHWDSYFGRIKPQFLKDKRDAEIVGMNVS